MTHLAEILGYLTLLMGIGELLTYVARKTQSKALKGLRGKHHMAWGKWMLAVALLHGAFTGNRSASGILAWMLVAALLATYHFRKNIGKNWLTWHRTLAVVWILVVLGHLVRYIGV